MLSWMTGQGIDFHAHLCDVMPELVAFVGNVAELAGELARQKAIQAELGRKLDPATSSMTSVVEGASAELSDMALPFCFLPMSRYHGFSSHSLCAGGDAIVLTGENAHFYVKLMYAQGIWHQ